MSEIPTEVRELLRAAENERNKRAGEANPSRSITITVEKGRFDIGQIAGICHILEKIASGDRYQVQYHGCTFSKKRRVYELNFTF